MKIIYGTHGTHGTMSTTSHMRRSQTGEEAARERRCRC